MSTVQTCLYLTNAIFSFLLPHSVTTIFLKHLTVKLLDVVFVMIQNLKLTNSLFPGNPKTLSLDSSSS